MKRLPEHLLAQFHPTHNGDLRPEDVDAGSDVPIWWWCPEGPDHAWQDTPGGRCLEDPAEHNCPFCTGLRVSVTNSLASLSPDVAAELHPTLNGSDTPDLLHNDWPRRVTWQCSDDQAHVWTARISDRTRKGQGCPFDAAARRPAPGKSLAERYPALAAQWDRVRNAPTRRPENTAWSSNKQAWWRCPVHESHSWQESPNRRTAPHRVAGSTGRCPFCSNSRACVTNSLATLRPDLAAQWHPTENGELTSHDVTAGTTRRVWWKCPEGDDHVWYGSVFNRTSQTGDFPFCTGHRLAADRSLAAVRPDLVGEWDDDANGDLRPEHVAAYSLRKVAWRCEAGPDHRWLATPADRVRGTTCPYCTGHKVSVTNSLQTLRPDLAAQWHPSNRLRSDQVTAHSSLPARWQCPRHALHTWTASPKNRNSGTGCPHCESIGVSRAELRVAWELRYCFPDIPHGRTRIIVERLPPALGRARTRGHREVDILLPSIGVVIEYDGVYWHKDKAKEDVLTSAELEAAGYLVIRIRERGLPHLSDQDIEVEPDAGNKGPFWVTCAVLQRLWALGYDVPRADKYLALDGPVHAAQAEREWTEKLRESSRRDKGGR